MTAPSQLLPSGAFNFSSIATLAARTKADWEAVWAGGQIPGIVETFVDFLTGFDDMLASSGLEPGTGVLIRAAFSGPLGAIILPPLQELIELVDRIVEFLDGPF